MCFYLGLAKSLKNQARDSDEIEVKEEKGRFRAFERTKQYVCVCVGMHTYKAGQLESV